MFEVFRSRYLGKVSPVHLFWGGLDLAVTRFSGRVAPPHPGGAPNCGPHVMWEAYSHEVSSAGYWPGPDGEGIFYSYAYPVPQGFAAADIGIPQARYDEALGEFVLPYEAVRTESDPDDLLLAFLQATYDAAADFADWDRAVSRTNLIRTTRFGSVHRGRCRALEAEACDRCSESSVGLRTDTATRGTDFPTLTVAPSQPNRNECTHGVGSRPIPEVPIWGRARSADRRAAERADGRPGPRHISVHNDGWKDSATRALRPEPKRS